ncbi:MAG: ABC transporter permease, partial [Azonexus sp.]|nr:ABC transporter permease [Azonexus sp.]
MSDFQVVVLWSDVLVWLLVAVVVLLAVVVRRSPPMLTAWQRVGRSRSGMASGTLLMCFVLVGLLD